MVSEPIKGFNDYTGEEALKRRKIRETAEKIFKLYGFEPAETPIIESENFVIGENKQDEAVSDVYRLKDKGDRALALRYEFTFQLKRIAQNKKLPYRRYQIGPVFRDEPVSGNRVRQITQCDIDVIGSSLKDDAEVLKTFSDLLKELKINAKIYLNNRKLLNEVLEELKIKPENRIAVIREIDKLDKLPEKEVRDNLRKFGAEKAMDIFSKPKKFFEKYKSYAEIKEVCDLCDNYKLDYEFSPFLARGLAYYTGTIFEIKTKEIKETICGGGSYLVNGIQATGISASIERLSVLAKTEPDPTKFLVISIGQDKQSIALAEKIRKQGKSCVVMFKISKAMDFANSYSIPNVIFVGEEEVKKKKFKLRNMKTGKEQMLSEKQILEID